MGLAAVAVLTLQKQFIWGAPLDTLTQPLESLITDTILSDELLSPSSLNLICYNQPEKKSALVHCTASTARSCGGYGAMDLILTNGGNVLIVLIVTNPRAADLMSAEYFLELITESIRRNVLGSVYTPVSTATAGTATGSDDSGAKQLTSAGGRFYQQLTDAQLDFMSAAKIAGVMDRVALDLNAALLRGRFIHELV